MRAGPRSKPTQREREEHEATHVPFRDWCAHCMMGRGRTHRHVAKQKSEDQSRRPIIAMDYFFMRMECSPSVQAISEESITCMNIMSSVALKKGVEEPWTIERVAKFIDLLGYREITLKSDTEPAIIAFRNRAALPPHSAFFSLFSSWISLVCCLKGKTATFTSSTLSPWLLQFTFLSNGSWAGSGSTTHSPSGRFADTVAAHRVDNSATCN